MFLGFFCVCFDRYNFKTQLAIITRGFFEASNYNCTSKEATKQQNSGGIRTIFFIYKFQGEVNCKCLLKLQESTSILFILMHEFYVNNRRL